MNPMRDPSLLRILLLALAAQSTVWGDPSYEFDERGHKLTPRESVEKKIVHNLAKSDANANTSMQIIYSSEDSTVNQNLQAWNETLYNQLANNWVQTFSEFTRTPIVLKVSQNGVLQEIRGVKVLRANGSLLTVVYTSSDRGDLKAVVRAADVIGLFENP